MWSELSSEQYSSPKGVTPLAATGAEQLSWHEMPSPHPGHPSRAMISFLPPSQKCPIWCPEHDCLLPSSLKLNILRGLGTAVDILLGTHHHQCILVFPHHPTKIPSLLGCPTKTWHNQRGRMEGTETSSWVRSWGLVPGAAVVWDGHDGLMQAVHHISMHIAILSAEPAHHHFRFLPAGFSGLKRKERVFIHFFFIGKDGRETTQSSCGIQQGWEPCSHVSELRKVIASLVPIPEKPLICVSANFEALSNLDKL